MSLASYSLASTSISELKAKEVTKKAPPKRIYTPVADRTAIPEPR